MCVFLEVVRKSPGAGKLTIEFVDYTDRVLTTVTQALASGNVVPVDVALPLSRPHSRRLSCYARPRPAAGRPPRRKSDSSCGKARKFLLHPGKVLRPRTPVTRFFAPLSSRATASSVARSPAQEARHMTPRIRIAAGSVVIGFALVSAPLSGQMRGTMAPATTGGQPQPDGPDAHGAGPRARHDGRRIVSDDEEHDDEDGERRRRRRCSGARQGLCGDRRDRRAEGANERGEGPASSGDRDAHRTRGQRASWNCVRPSGRSRSTRPRCARRARHWRRS